MIVATRLVPAGFDAITLGPVILVRPGAVGDTALLAHERVHQSEQLFAQAVYWVALFALLAAAHAESAWWLLLFAVSPWWVAYLLVPRFRLQAELRAYARQIALRGISKTLAAHYLSTLYRLDLTFSQALELLEEQA